MVIFLSIEKITWGTLISATGELTTAFNKAAAKILPFLPRILSTDSLGKDNINSNFLPCQVGQRVKSKRSWQLTLIHLHQINGTLDSSCAFIPCKEREFGKSKIPKCHRNVRFGSDSLPRDHSSRFPLSHQKLSGPISRTTRQPAAPFEIFLLYAQTLEQEELLSLLYCRGEKFWPLH